MAKANVYITPGSALEALKSGLAEGQRFSTSVNLIVGRYQEMIRRTVVPLADNERDLIRDALNGTILWDRPEHVRYLPVEIEDAVKINGLAKKWELQDADEFIARIHALSFAELCALCEDAEAFWRADATEDE